MNTAISCATCSRPLRIPSTLLGQTVRCPFCFDEFIAVADPNIKLEEAAVRKAAVHAEELVREPAGVALLEPEPPVVEEVFTVDLTGPAKAPPPPKRWSTWVFVRSDTDRRLWGEMEAEISAEGVRLFRGRKDLMIPVGCEATWVGGSVVRVIVGSRTVEFQIKKKHVYKRRVAADLAGFLNGDRPMPANKGYRWPWYQWLMLLAPLGLIGVLIVGELPDTDMKGLKGFAIVMMALLGPLLGYALWHIEPLRVGFRWAGASLLVAAFYLLAIPMYFFGPNLPPAAPYATWYAYTPGEGRYSISMPATTLTESQYSNGMNLTRTMARVKPNQTFVVAYADLYGNFNNPWERDYAIDRGKEYLRREYKTSYLYNDRTITLDDVQGKEFYFNPGSGRRGTATARVFLVGTRLYILVVQDAQGSNGTKFLDSFKPDVPDRPGVASPQTLPGLLAYWSFDAGNGHVVNEDTRTQLQMPLNNCQWTNGVRGKGIQLMGNQNSHFDYGNRQSLNFAANASFTFCGWFKTTQWSTMVMSQRHSRSDSAMINLMVENSVLVADVRHDAAQPGVAPVRVAGFQAVNDGKWHHFALVRELNGAMHLYLDGTSQGLINSPDARGAITTDLRVLGTDLYNRKQKWVPTPFQGSMDEFCVFNRPLTLGEIHQLAGTRGF